MSTNYYLKVEQERKNSEHYLERKDNVFAVLEKHNITFPSTEEAESFLQEILDTLEINDFTDGTNFEVVYYTSVFGEHLGKQTNSGGFSFDMDPTTIANYPPDTIVVDAYYEEMTMEKFRRDILEAAAYLKTDSIGTHFS